MEAHHKFGPSSLKYIEICPGFRNSNETNPVAEEGTFLHEACESGDLEGLSEEQQGLVGICLDYLTKLEKGADEIHKEIKLDIGIMPDGRRENAQTNAANPSEGRQSGTSS